MKRFVLITILSLLPLLMLAAMPDSLKKNGSIQKAKLSKDKSVLYFWIKDYSKNMPSQIYKINLKLSSISRIKNKKAIGKIRSVKTYQNKFKAELKGRVLYIRETNKNKNFEIKLGSIKTSKKSEFFVTDNEKYLIHIQGNSASSYLLKGLKKLASFIINFSDKEASSIYILENRLYINNCVGAGPGGTGQLYNSVTGKKLCDIPYDKKYPLNTYQGSFYKIRKNHWVFLDGEGSMLTWLDIKTGKVIKHLKLIGSDPDTGTRSIRINKSKIAIIYGSKMGTSSAGRVSIIDIRKKKLIKHINPK